MEIEIFAIGGYGEVGRNMTAVKYGEEIVIFDVGLHMPNYIRYTDEKHEGFEPIDPAKLRKVDAIPRDEELKKMRSKVKAIVIGHAHLDHIGAVPYVTNSYDAPLICTKFAKEILKGTLRDSKIELKNEIITLQPGSRMKLTDDLELEFIKTTHSIPETVMCALHTPAGIVLYATDFKFDDTPVLGPIPDYERLKAIKGKVKVAILDTLYANTEEKSPSEKEARDMLRQIMLEENHEGRLLIITTFSSQIARLKSIIEFGKQMNRKIVFLGRSLAKYLYAAKDSGLIDLTKDVTIVKYGSQVRKMLDTIEKNRDQYLLICTGHQGEPKAILSRIVQGLLDFKFTPKDTVVFSCRTIPVEESIKNREKLESKLKKLGCRIFKDIHVSGHGFIEDDRELIKILKPKKIVPAHGDRKITLPAEELAKDMGKFGEQARISMRNIREEGMKDIDEDEINKEISEDEKFKQKENLQKLIDKYNKKIQDLISNKEKEILE